MISTSPNQVTHIRAEHGYPLAVKLAFTKVDDSPMDLTGCMLLFYLSYPKHKGGAAILSQVAIPKDTPNSLGLALLSVQGEDLQLPKGEYPFVISVTPTEGLATIVVKGVLEIELNANTVGTPDFTLVSPAIELSVKLAKQNKVIVRTNHLPDHTLVAYVDNAAESASQAGIYAGQAAASADSAADSAAAAALSEGSSEEATAAAAAASTAADASSDSADVSADEAAASAAAAQNAANAAAQGEDWANAAASSAAEAAYSKDSAATSAAVAENAVEYIEDFTKGDTGPQGAPGVPGNVGPTGVQLVFHGTNPLVPRPSFSLVYWIGSAVPAHATDYDWWLPEDVTP
jgi:hypothetical protein